MLLFYRCAITNAIKVVHHSDSLIHFINNNHVEGYNSIVAKYVGCKRINYSLRGKSETKQLIDYCFYS